MPRTGAIYLVNGKHKRRAAPIGRVIARLRNRRRHNGIGVKINSRRRRNATFVLRNRRRHNGIGVRMNGIGVRMNPRRGAKGRFTRSNRRKNGIGVRMNPRRGAKGRFVRGNRRRNSTYVLRNRRRKNQGGLSLGFLTPITNLLKKIPFVGHLIIPALGGALVVGGVHMVLKYAVPYLPAMVVPYITPIGYTIGGVVVGLALMLVPSSILSPATKASIASIAVVGGGAVDAIRYLSGTESTMGGHQLGDGGLWQLGNDDDGMLDGDEMALQQEYSDASLLDAAYSGEDLDQAEGEACLAGPRMWRQRFPHIRRMTHTRTDATSRHSRCHGHRWAWLCRLIGFKRFQQLVQLPAADRLTYIKALREFAVTKAQEQLSQQATAAVSASPAAATAGWGALVYSQ
jgi:hypothetical protein